MPVSRSPASHGSRNTGHRPRLRSYRCAATRKVPESQVLVLVRRRETNPLRAVSKIMRADIGSAKPERRSRQVAKADPQNAERGSHSQRRLWVQRSPTKHHDVDLLLAGAWSGQASNRAWKGRRCPKWVSALSWGRRDEAELVSSSCKAELRKRHSTGWSPITNTPRSIT